MYTWQPMLFRRTELVHARRAAGPFQKSRNRLRAGAKPRPRPTLRRPQLLLGHPFGQIQAVAFHLFVQRGAVDFQLFRRTLPIETVGL